jgi:hypothetical protein
MRTSHNYTVSLSLYLGNSVKIGAKKAVQSCGNQYGSLAGVMILHGSNEGCNQRVSLI